jgi:hypothetical protein
MMMSVPLKVKHENVEYFSDDKASGEWINFNSVSGELGYIHTNNYIKPEASESYDLKCKRGSPIDR